VSSRGKGVSVTYPECACITRVIWHAMRMRHIVTSVACPALKYFSTLSHKRHDFMGGGEGIYLP